MRGYTDTVAGSDYRHVQNQRAKMDRNYRQEREKHLALKKMVREYARANDIDLPEELARAAGLKVRAV